MRVFVRDDVGLQGFLSVLPILHQNSKLLQEGPCSLAAPHLLPATKTKCRK